jgi:hypothetical protein
VIPLYSFFQRASKPERLDDTDRDHSEAVWPWARIGKIFDIMEENGSQQYSITTPLMIELRGLWKKRGRENERSSH